MEIEIANRIKNKLFYAKFEILRSELKLIEFSVDEKDKEFIRIMSNESTSTVQKYYKECWDKFKEIVDLTLKNINTK